MGLGLQVFHAPLLRACMVLQRYSIGVNAQKGLVSTLKKTLNSPILENIARC